MINLTGSEKLPITPAHQKNAGVILVVIVFHSVDLSSLSCSLTGIFVLYYEAAVFTKVVQVRYANHDCRYHVGSDRKHLSRCIKFERSYCNARNLRNVFSVEI